MTPNSFEESAVAAAKRHFESKNVSKKTTKTVSKRWSQNVPKMAFWEAPKRLPKWHCFSKKFRHVFEKEAFSRNLSLHGTGRALMLMELRSDVKRVKAARVNRGTR